MKYLVMLLRIVAFLAVLIFAILLLEILIAALSPGWTSVLLVVLALTLLAVILSSLLGI